ncbi:MAG: phosphatidate cytidylyltransferase [Candidatus Lernaella stagnicola]|nr:phosphatidate cytidylyltransferase [Candidatus Lernaella stagnicola]
MKAKKVLVALVLLPAFVWLIGWAPWWALMAVLLALGAGVGGWESARLAFGEQDLTFRVLATGLSVGCAYAAATGSDEMVGMAVVLTTLIALGVAGLASTKQENAVSRAAKLVFVAIYPGLLVGYIAALRVYQDIFYGEKLVIILFLIPWINDAGAFFVGSALGKRKMAPRISPNKTWEGAMGGFAASLLAGLGVGIWSSHLSVGAGLLIGGVLGVVGPLGDLVESAIKRGAEVKDSGQFLPGHGGVLDRIDSVIVCAPVLYYFIVEWHFFELMKTIGP